MKNKQVFSRAGSRLICYIRCLGNDAAISTCNVKDVVFLDSPCSNIKVFFNIRYFKQPTVEKCCNILDDRFLTLSLHSHQANNIFMHFNFLIASVFSGNTFGTLKFLKFFITKSCIMLEKHIYSLSDSPTSMPTLACRIAINMACSITSLSEVSTLPTKASVINDKRESFISFLL